MKPQNKFQKQLVEVQKKLQPVSEKQLQWGIDNCIQYIGQKTEKGKITCTKCSHSWIELHGELMDSLLGTECPHCKAKLKVENTRKRVFKQCEYLCYITTCKGFQVIRYVMVNIELRVGLLPKITHSEVVQRWIAPNGKYATFARLRQTMGTMYYDAWIFHTPLELRNENYIYDRIHTDNIYPVQRLLPELKRAGYKPSFSKEYRPMNYIRAFLDNRMETLYKIGQKDLFMSFLNNDKFAKLDKYWNSIRICLRNKYTIQDVSIWCDYIDLLSDFGKDLHNAKYVCPADLKTEHDKYVRKKRKIQEIERRRAEIERKEQAILMAKEKEEKFFQLKSKFFGLEFTNGLIQVRVLESVEEIREEGDRLHHCVFTNEYHLKPESLILSASIGDKKIETVELSLSQMEILQCRGVNNDNTQYHNDIIQLVHNNIPLIEKRMIA